MAEGEMELRPWTHSLGVETPPSEGSCLRVHPHRRKLVRDQQGLQNIARTDVRKADQEKDGAKKKDRGLRCQGTESQGKRVSSCGHGFGFLSLGFLSLMLPAHFQVRTCGPAPCSSLLPGFIGAEPAFQILTWNWLLA